MWWPCGSPCSARPASWDEVGRGDEVKPVVGVPACLCVPGGVPRSVCGDVPGRSWRPWSPLRTRRWRLGGMGGGAGGGKIAAQGVFPGHSAAWAAWAAWAAIGGCFLLLKKKKKECIRWRPVLNPGRHPVRRERLFRRPCRPCRPVRRIRPGLVGFLGWAAFLWVFLLPPMPPRTVPVEFS